MGKDAKEYNNYARYIADLVNKQTNAKAVVSLLADLNLNLFRIHIDLRNIAKQQGA